MYTARWVRTHSDLELHRQIEWLWVKALPGDGAPWVTGQRKKDDGIFERDPVTKLSGIGEEKAKELKRVGKVKEVAHVARLSDKKIETLAESRGLSVGLLEKARDEAKTAKPGKFKSKIVNHKKKANPYKSLYKEDWIKFIDASTNMKK